MRTNRRNISSGLGALIALGVLLLPRIAAAVPAAVSPTPQVIAGSGISVSRGTVSSTATLINVRDATYGARGNAKSGEDGVFTSGSSNFHSASAAFSVADVGKTIEIDGAAGAGSAPLVTTIAAYVGAHDVTLAASPTASGPLYYLAGGTVVTPEATGSYQPGDALQISGGTSTATGALTVWDTTVVGVAVASAGSGGANGTCTLYGTTGSGTLAKFTATISGGAISGTPTIAGGGHYFANPTAISAEPVTSSCGGLTGATLTLTMGVDAAYVSTPGLYTVKPSSPTATVAGSLSGATGATFSPSWTATGWYRYGTDDSAAIKAAINAQAATWAAGQPACVYLPAANYYVGANTLPGFSNYGGCIRGDGHNKTNIIVGAAYSGDVLWWSEAWLRNEIQFNGASGSLAQEQAGPIATGFTVMGDRLSANSQNCMTFYDRNDLVYVDDVDCRYLNGRGLYSGVTKNSSQAYMRESHLGRMRFFNVGSASSPVIDFNSQGPGDATNEININEFDVYAPYGTALVVHSNGGNIRDLKFGRLRIEGLERDSAHIQADFIQIGDPVLTGQISSIDFHQLEIVDPYPNYSGIHVTAPSSATQPYWINVAGVFTGGAPLGGGVKVDYGRSMNFRLTGMSTYQTNVTLGASTGTLVCFDSGGDETSTWTWSVNASAQHDTCLPVRQFGDPSGLAANNAPFFQLGPYWDQTVKGGNNRGEGAVDFQVCRTAPTQVASGQQSFVGPGCNNTASGQNSIVWGTGNSASGAYNVCIGLTVLCQQNGAEAWGQGTVANLYGQWAFGYGDFSAQGNAQASLFVLRGSASGTTAARLTSDGSAAASNNTLNLVSTNATRAIRISLTASDTTASGNALAYFVSGLLARSSTNASTTWTTTAVATSAALGTGASLTVSITADTSNGGLNISVTPPGGNTDTWHFVARVDSTDTF